MDGRIARMISQSAWIVFFALINANGVSAQQVVGAKAGIIQHIYGEVFLDGNPLSLPEDGYIQMENGQSLRTGQGLVELLLAPSAYLRMGGFSSSSLRMEQNELNNTQVSLEQGSALIEIVQKLRGNPIRVRFSKGLVEIKKTGRYRLDADSSELRVHKGAALVTGANKTFTVKKGRMLRLDRNWKAVKFDPRAADLLDHFSAARTKQLYRMQARWDLERRTDLEAANSEAVNSARSKAVEDERIRQMQETRQAVEEAERRQAEAQEAMRQWAEQEARKQAAEAQAAGPKQY